jgi:hypothetical protein
LIGQAALNLLVKADPALLFIIVLALATIFVSVHAGVAVLPVAMLIHSCLSKSMGTSSAMGCMSCSMTNSYTPLLPPQCSRIESSI